MSATPTPLNIAKEKKHISSRMTSTQVAPGAYRVLLSLAQYVRECGIVA
jgi:hypothetical protein